MKKRINPSNSKDMRQYSLYSPMPASMPASMSTRAPGMASLSDLKKTQAEVHITGHRGMGVNQKVRSLLHKGAVHYPENSIESFITAIEQGAAALECDIHVSKDNEAMVIHGSKIAPYADLIFYESELYEQEIEVIVQEIKETKERKEIIEQEIKGRKEIRQQDINEIRQQDINEIIGIIEQETKERKEIIEQEKKERKEIKEVKEKETNERIKQVKKDNLKTCLLNLHYEINSISIDGMLQVEKFTKTELQTMFSLRGYNAEDQNGRIFDSLSVKEKKLSVDSPEGFDFVLKKKQELLARSPKMHQIPTLYQLLELVGQANKKRYDFNKPFLKLNIELKGKNSAIASIFSILEFYKNSPHASYVNPEDIIFLGTRTVGEIVIANAILKCKKNTHRGLASPIPDLGMSELFTFISPEVRNQLFFKYFMQYRKAQKSGGHIAQGDERAFIIAQMYQATMESREGELRNQLLEGWYKLKSSGKKLTPQQRNEEVQFIIDQIHSKLALTRTTLMLSTGDLFGSGAVIDPNFNLDTRVANITREGFLTIKKALKFYGYNGIDISLFDYCSGVYTALSQAIIEGNLDRNRLILGATAANWRASARERYEESIHYAYEKAAHTVEMTNIPLLLKVDEPGCFENVKVKREQSKINPFVQEYIKNSLLPNTRNESNPSPNYELLSNYTNDQSSPPLSGPSVYELLSNYTNDQSSPPLSGPSVNDGVSRMVSHAWDAEAATTNRTTTANRATLNLPNRKPDRDVVPENTKNAHSFFNAGKKKKYTEQTSSQLACNN